jgi:hypothetical protein
MRIILFFAVLATLCVARAASAKSEEMKRDAKGERIWEITDYLKGTRFEIRDKLNSDTHRLSEKITETEAKIADAKREIEIDRGNFIAKAHRDPAYVKAKLEAEVAKIELDDAHAQRDSAAAMDAGSRYNKARALLAKLDREITAGANTTDEIVKDSAFLDRYTEELNRLRESHTKAVAWRKELIDATKTTLRLSWPVVRGTNGLLGEMMPVVISADGVLADYKAREPIDAKASGEGLATIQILIHPMRIYVSGLDTSKMKEGQEVEVQQNVEVTGLDDGRSGLVILSRVKHVDEDDLMKTIIEP